MAWMRPDSLDGTTGASRVKWESLATFAELKIAEIEAEQKAMKHRQKQLKKSLIYFRSMIELGIPFPLQERT